MICPDNTIHRALPAIEARSPLPWLHIAEVVAVEAATRGLRRLGLLGTRWLVESEVYPVKLREHGPLSCCGMKPLQPKTGVDASLPCCHTMCRRTDFSAQNVMCVSSLIRVKKRTMIDGR
jgi:hypothetical protein